MLPVSFCCVGWSVGRESERGENCAKGVKIPETRGKFVAGPMKTRGFGRSGRKGIRPGKNNRLPLRGDVERNLDSNFFNVMNRIFTKDDRAPDAPDINDWEPEEIRDGIRRPSIRGSLSSTGSRIRLFRR